MSNKYEIELSLKDRRSLLIEVANDLQRYLTAITKKRTWRESEKAMATYKTKCRLTAVQMALDDLARPSAGLAYHHSGEDGEDAPSNENAL